MRINHNISAMNTNNQLIKTGSALDKSLERLSSGYRINHASDDAAGMAISRRMKTQIEGLERASMNSSDGISAIQTAEGALIEVTSMLQRMRELAVQAANGVNTIEDRASIQQEITQLSAEIDRISKTTEFNTKTLLDGNVDNNSYSSNTSVNLIYTSDYVECKDYTFTVTRDARQAIVQAGQPTFDEVAEDEKGTITINGIPVAVTEGQTVEQVFTNLRNVCDSMNIDVFFGDGPNGSDPIETAGYEKTDIGEGNLIFMSKAYGSHQHIDIQCNNENLASAMGLSTTTVSARGYDVEVTLGEGYSKTATMIGDGDLLYIRDNNGFEMRYQITPGLAETAFTDASGDGDISSSVDSSEEVESVTTLLDAGTMYLQVGANEGQNMEVSIPRLDCLTLGIAYANVCTQDGADAAITLFDNAVNQVSAIRSKLGAFQNRLDHGVSNLGVASENMTEAMSRIEDVDMAKEMTNYTQKSVLDQAGTSMLAQANQRPQNILTLLQG